MKLFRILISLGLVIAMSAFSARAQEPKTPEQQEKELREAIDKEIDKYIRTLDIDMAQEFYLDSILTHDYFAMRDEIMEKSRAKVNNMDVYQAIQDKWAERIYVAFRKVLDDEQWEKYLKGGAGREKKARDKREAKRK